jgi:O-antigen ligase
MGWTGAALTIFYLASILFVNQPFLAGRFRSFFVLPTNFSNTYVLLYVAMLWLGLSKDILLRKVIIWTALVIGICLLALSATRNPVLFLFAAIGVFSLVWRVKVPILIALFISFFLIVVLLYYQESKHMQFLADRLSSFTTFDREVLWKTSWSYISNRPLLGYGFGRELAFLAKMPEWGKLNTHNAYLGIWLQLGLFAAISIIFLYLAAIKKGLSFILMRSTSNALRNVISLPTALLIGLFLSGFFEENMTSRGSIQQCMWAISILMINGIDIYAEKE